MIQKEASDCTAFLERYHFTKTARSAFLHILRKERDAGKTLLLPAYIGLNNYEGSGVFDVVRISRIPFEFYALNDQLEPVTDNLQNLADNHYSLLVIHYFGFYPSNFEAILHLAAQKNWHLIEDCAHTLDGHYKGKLLGSIGDFGFHAIHKILPTTDGGILRNNNVNCHFEISPEEEGIKLSTLDIYNRSEMSRISAMRRQNFNHYLERLPIENKHYRLLHTALPDGVVPLNFPVLIQNGKREQVYFKMVEKGAVPVSLYHTLIPEVMLPEFSNTVAFSSMILNFPVHQDTLKEDADRVCDTFLEILNQL